MGDVGTLAFEDEVITVVATEKENGQIIHIVEALPYDMSVGCIARVDAAKRQQSANNHTATHLLHKALREVLGTHVEQKGSQVAPSSLRFDFAHFQKVTPEQLREVELRVNAAIRANSPLDERREATMQQAQECGAMMLFGEKYGDSVRIIGFGESVELCGGTHAAATGQIGLFRIASESAISAGVRRIEALTGEAAINLSYVAEDLVKSMSELLNSPQQLAAVKKLIDSNATLSSEIETMRHERAASLAEKFLSQAQEEDGVVVISHLISQNGELLRELALAMRAKCSNLVLVIGSDFGGKPSLVVAIGADIESKGVNAGEVVRQAAKLIQGGGGGQKGFATAGGKNLDGLGAAVECAKELITSKL